MPNFGKIKLRHTMKTRPIILSLILLLTAFLPVRATSDTVIKDLRVEHGTEPLAIEEAHPAFSWKMESTQKGQKPPPGSGSGAKATAAWSGTAATCKIPFPPAYAIWARHSSRAWTTNGT